MFFCFFFFVFFFFFFFSLFRNVLIISGKIRPNPYLNTKIAILDNKTMLALGKYAHAIYIFVFK